MRLTYSHFYIPKYCHYSKPIKGLQGCGVSYRFAFNGKEKENESYGNGNEYDFGARIYDPRLGRWISCDPLALKYPDQTPYNYCVNSPILFIDPDGKEIIVSGVKYVPLQLRTAADIERINKGGDFVQQTMAALDQIYMQADASGCDKVTFLVNTKIAVNIQNNNGEFGFNSDVTTVRDADGV
ncbi:MAG: hypothetical protein RJA83_1159, partial [Pseudomonadota bacterium]